MSFRWVLACGGFLAALAAATWPQAPPATGPASRLSPLEAGRFYAVDFAGGPPSIDLEFDGDCRYELIVSSLGDATRTYPVGLSARPFPRVELFPAAPVAPGVPRILADAPPPPSTRPSREAVVVAGAVERRFFLHVTADRLEDERGYVPVTARLAGEGRKVRVYLDRETSPAELAAGLIDEIIARLDHEIIPRSRQWLGEHVDVDGDQKLAVLVTNWLGKLCGGKTSLNGFVRSNDFQADVEAPFGNCADVIYLNAAISRGPALQALLAHEYTHAVCFSRRLARSARRRPLPVEEDWLNEGLAHVAENRDDGGWSNLDQRITVYLAAPETAPLVVRDYYRAGLWRDAGCRGATFLFLRHCTDQFGDGMLRRLVEGPAGGTPNLERATKTPFPELFRQWTIVLAEGRLGALSLYGRLGDCDLCGAAHREWRAEEGPFVGAVCGTATSFIELVGPAQPGVLRISVDAEPDARVQFTLRRLKPRPESRSKDLSTLAGPGRERHRGS